MTLCNRSCTKEQHEQKIMKVLSFIMDCDLFIHSRFLHQTFEGQSSSAKPVNAIAFCIKNELISAKRPSTSKQSSERSPSACVQWHNGFCPSFSIWRVGSENSQIVLAICVSFCKGFYLLHTYIRVITCIQYSICFITVQRF